MPKTKQQKSEEFNDVREKFSRAKSVVVGSYGAMSVAQSQELRRLLRAEGAEYVSVKKTIVGVYAKEKPELGLEPAKWPGSIGLIFGFQDEVAPAKVLSDFRKKNNIIKAVGGIFENHWIGEEEVQVLSTLPSKQQLRGQIVGLIAAPLQGLVGVLNANVRNVVTVIDAIGKAKS